MQNANNPYFFNKDNQINSKLSSVGFSIVKNPTLFTISKKWPLIDRRENGHKMVKSRKLVGSIKYMRGRLMLRMKGRKVKEKEGGPL